MSRRKQLFEEHENNERWLVSYADFITLLFAFFVVMYSVSSVNEGKYRVLSDSIGSAFHKTQKVLNPADDGAIIDTGPLLGELIPTAQQFSDTQTVVTPLSIEYQQSEAERKQREQEVEDREKQQFQRQLDRAESEIDTMAGHVEERMESLIDDDTLKVKRNKFWLEVEIKSSLLFSSGSSNLIPGSSSVLVELAAIFRDLPNRIHIEGYTDNKPINTLAFPSNWELSAARAAAVIRLFENNGVESSRMAAIGYSQYHPIDSNDSEEGRAINRRVVLIVMASLPELQNEKIYEFDLLKG